MTRQEPTEITRVEIRRVALAHSSLLQGWKRNAIIGVATVTGVTAVVWAIVGWQEASIGIVSALATWGVLGIVVLGEWIYQLSQAKAHILEEQLQAARSELEQYETKASHKSRLEETNDKLEQVAINILARMRAAGSHYLEGCERNVVEWKKHIKEWETETSVELAKYFTVAETMRFQVPPKLPKYVQQGLKASDPQHAYMIRKLMAQIEILDEIVRERFGARLRAGKPLGSSKQKIKE